MTAILRKVFAKSHLRIYLIRTFNKSQSVTNSQQLYQTPVGRVPLNWNEWHVQAMTFVNHKQFATLLCFDCLKHSYQSVKWLWISQKMHTRWPSELWIRATSELKLAWQGFTKRVTIKYLLSFIHLDSTNGKILFHMLTICETLKIQNIVYFFNPSARFVLLLDANKYHT